MEIFTKRNITWALFVLATLLGLYFVFRQQPIAIDTAVIKTGDMAVTVDEEGVTKVREVYMVSAPLAGRLERSPLKVGDKVIQNKTVVAIIEPAEVPFLDERSRNAAQAAVKAAQSTSELAKARVLQARAELEFAEQDLKRAVRLGARGTISERALDQARLTQKIKDATHKSSKAELQVRLEELESARANLIEPGNHNHANTPSCCVNITAPVTGRVLQMVKQSRQIVRPGETILELGDPLDLEIVVDLLSTDAIKVKKGMSANIEGWGGDKILNARVRRVEPTGFKKISALGIEEQRVNVRLDLLDPYTQWRSLGHDFRVFVRVKIWEGSDILQVPLSALFRVQDKWAVFVFENGLATQKIIEINHRNTRFAEIIKGLSKGDKVVLHPNNEISDGVSIVERQGVK